MVGGFFGYFRNKSAENLADFCASFRPVFDSEKCWKIHLLYTSAKFIVSGCVRSFVLVPATSVQWKPCIWLNFSDQHIL